MGNDNDNISTRLTYLLIGGGIGAIIALLFAPKSGQELRGDLADATRKGIDKSREAAQQIGERAGESEPDAGGRAGDHRVFPFEHGAFLKALKELRNWIVRIAKMPPRG